MAPSRAEENFRHTDVDLERSGQTTATRRADFSPLSAQAKPQSDVTAVRGRALQRAPRSVAGADATGRCNLRLLSTSRLLVNRRYVVALPRGASGCRQQDAAAAFWKPPTGATEFPPFASRNGSPQRPHPARLQLRQQHLGISEAEIAPNFFQAHPLAEESAVSSPASDEKGPPIARHLRLRVAEMVHSAPRLWLLAKKRARRFQRLKHRARCASATFSPLSAQIRRAGPIAHLSLCSQSEHLSLRGCCSGGKELEASSLAAGCGCHEPLSPSNPTTRPPGWPKMHQAFTRPVGDTSFIRPDLGSWGI